MKQTTEPNRFDVIVIGGGHAGTEAAMASARMGCRTLLLTQQIDTLGQMSCNPAIGGIGKGHLTKEIDALGGIMAQAIDASGIHFRTLNASKGPAVQATRAQADRALYQQAIKRLLTTQPNLFLFQQSVHDIRVKNQHITGVITQTGLTFHARSVVLATGTFLGGKIHIGQSQFTGGRAGDAASLDLATRLRALPFRVGRLKTGTPPRLDGRTINYAVMQEQPSDPDVPPFSFVGDCDHRPEQVPCFLTDTNEQTHDIIRHHLKDSPLFSGSIEGIGPRYCPSIEDKVVRFSGRNAHRIFLEPEGLHTHEVYPNGISTSLPFEAQTALVQSIRGLESAHLTRPGYAIEYDFFDPRDLTPWLETQYITGLFFAGQINGTTGYEEAGAQGLLAGINAALKIQGHQPWYPSRSEAYLGVLIDDLVTNGTNEPYRMFTSRAEHRLLLREDNADLRLTPLAQKLGLIGPSRWTQFEHKKNAITEEQNRLSHIRIHPNTEEARALAQKGQPIHHDTTLLELLKRPQWSYCHMAETLPNRGPFIADPQVRAHIEIEAKYAGYIQRQQKAIEKQQHHEQARLPEDIDYQSIKALSHEVRQKLTQVRPQTISQAARISGVTPAAISILLLHVT